MNKILVVYYSRTGNTEKVAQEIASMCNADIETIRCAKKGDRGFGFLRALFATITQREIPVQDSSKQLENYDIIAIGTPVWMYKLTPFIRGFLKRYSEKFQQVAFFCTEGSSGDTEVFKQMSKEISLAPTATLTVSEREINEQLYLAKLISFTKHLTGETTESKYSELA